MSDMDSAAAILSTAVADAPATTTHDAAPDASQVSDAEPSSSSDAAVELTESGEGSDQTEPGQGKTPTTQQIRASLKAFRDSNPEHSQAAKLLNDGYSRYEAFKEVFPTVDDARTVKAQLDAIGGLEGLSQLSATVNAIEETDSLLDAGDPKVLDQIFEDSPEGAIKLAPHYLERLAKANPEAFASTLQPHFFQSIAASNLPAVVDYLAQQLGDKPELQKVVQSVQQWIQGQKSLAEKANVNALNPDRERLSKEWDNLNKERRSELDSYVSSQMNGYISNELGTRLKPFSASLSALPVGQRQAVARAAMSELGAALKADKAYQNQINAMMNAKKPERDKIVSLNKAKVAALADGIVRKVVTDFGLKAGAVSSGKRGADGKFASTKTNSDPNAPVKIVQLNARPKDDLIDWDYPRADEAYIRGRAKLKDGRFVQWPK